MKPTSKIIFLIALFLLSFSSLALAAAQGPKAEIDAVLAELVNVVESNPGTAKQSARREQMRAVISPRFDFKEMAKRSLGAYWNKCTPEEQEEFVTVFSDLLAATYLNKIDMLERNMVKVVDEKTHEDKAMVKTMVTYKGDTFGLDYKLLERENTWKVYDVIIENIGLVANYRNEFAGIIRKEKFAGLMTKLKEKSKAQVK